MKRRVILSIAVPTVIFLIALGGIYAAVSVKAAGKTFEGVEEVPVMETGLLLGTSPVTPQGGHNYYFDYRVRAAAELFHAGKIKRIIASGGDYSGKQKYGCNELKAMRDSLMLYGVPDTLILLDYDGQRTINSIVNARAKYGADSVTLISQKYHNERALWLAEHEGLNAVAYNAPISPSRRKKIKNLSREVLARVKMLMETL